MIEILNEPTLVEEEETKEPRNIRQIGNVKGEDTVYMEDYVYRFLHSNSRRKSRYVFIFLGEIQKKRGKHLLFIKGALELSGISFGGGLPVFSEDMWDEIYRDCRQYFPNWAIVGWAMQTMGGVIDDVDEIKRISNRHFPANHGNVFIYDAYGEWEQMYLDTEGQLFVQPGFCIYYEKNAPMGSYLSAYHAKREKEYMLSDEDTQERLLVHDESKYENQIRQDAEAMARYRSYMNGQQDRIQGQRAKVAISVAVVVLMLLSGVLIQNYATLSDMEDAVEALSNQEAVKKAQEEVVKETISKKASELEQVTEAADQKKAGDEANSLGDTKAEDATSTPENAYLTQGYYIVEKGDKLTDISMKVYGTKDMVSQICEKNNLADQDHIQPGDKLLLP